MPPFEYTRPSNEQTLAIARARGLFAEGDDERTAIRHVARVLGAADRRLGPTAADAFTQRLEAALLDGRVALSSQLFAAIARGSRQVAACTVIGTSAGADGPRLQALIAEAMVASEAGMGCGLDVSSFRDPGETARRVNAALVDFDRALRARRRRPPAFMITCDANHPGVLGFVAAKRGADFEDWVANLSVRFGADAATFQRLSGAIAEAAHDNGEPGVLFGAPADDDNPTPGDRLESTAPCAEVFMAVGERCVFVSINLAAHVRCGRIDWPEFAASARLAVRCADAAVEFAAAGAPPIVGRRRRIGIGICGFHSALITLGIPYAEAAGTAAAVAEQLAYNAHAESACLAELRGPFPAWRRSRWRDVGWLRRKAEHRAATIAPTEWSRLETRILRSGVRHAVIVAHPPTGIVSELLGVSKSYEPHFSLLTHGGRLWPEVAAAVGPGEAIVADGQLAGAAPGHLLACARQITPDVHLDVHAAFCRLADEAGSKTVNLPCETSVEDVVALLSRARELGLKGLTVFRDQPRAVAAVA